MFLTSYQTVNGIESKDLASLVEALKINKALIELYLYGEHKRTAQQ